MKTKRYSQAQKSQLIKEIADCGSIALVCDKHNIPRSTAHSWIKPKSKAKSLENQESLQKMRKKLADKELKIKILEDLLKKTNHAWLGD